MLVDVVPDNGVLAVMHGVAARADGERAAKNAGDVGGIAHDFRPGLPARVEGQVRAEMTVEDLLATAQPVPQDPGTTCRRDGESNRNKQRRHITVVRETNEAGAVCMAPPL